MHVVAAHPGRILHMLWLLTLEKFSTVWHQLKESLHLAFMVLWLAALKGDVEEAWQDAD